MVAGPGRRLWPEHSDQSGRHRTGFAVGVAGRGNGVVTAATAALAGANLGAGLPQRTVAGADLFHHLCVPVRDQDRQRLYLVPGLGKSDDWPGVADQRQRRGNLPWRHRFDPRHAMGGGTLAGLHPWTDFPFDHPAAVLQTHVAALDEPLCGDHHGHGTGLSGGGA
ncbi:hypothetical protein D3C85_1444150 [compost metagenome]